MWEAYFYGAVLRMAQALLESAPFLVAGLFVAGVLQRLLGRLLFVLTANPFAPLVEEWHPLLRAGQCVVPAIRLLPVSFRALDEASLFAGTSHFQIGSKVDPGLSAGDIAS